MSDHALIPGRAEWGDPGLWCRRCGRLIHPHKGGFTAAATRPCTGPAPASAPPATPRTPEPSPRVRVYIDTADWWVGLYIGPNHYYFCVLTLVCRVKRRRPSAS